GPPVRLAGARAPGELQHQHAHAAGVDAVCLEGDLGDAVDLLLQWCAGLGRVADSGHEAAPPGLEDELEQLLLVLEVVVDEPVGDACLARHVGDAAAVVPFPCEDLDRGPEDGLPPVLVARLRCGAGLGSRHWSLAPLALTRKSAPDPRGQHPGGQASVMPVTDQTVVAGWEANIARATPSSFSTSRLSRCRERTNSEMGRRSSSPLVP